MPSNHPMSRRSHPMLPLEESRAKALAAIEAVEKVPPGSPITLERALKVADLWTRVYQADVDRERD